MAELKRLANYEVLGGDIKGISKKRYEDILTN
jgi:hypothetical protein